MIECPKCGDPISVNERTVSVVCRCGRYIRRDEFKETGVIRFSPLVMVKRDDRNMQIMRERVAQIESGAQAQLDRARAQKQGE